MVSWMERDSFPENRQRRSRLGIFTSQRKRGQIFFDNSEIVNRSGKYEMKGFGPDLLWTVLRSGCRATKSRRSQSESAKRSVATGLPAVFLEGLPVGLHRRQR